MNKSQGLNSKNNNRLPTGMQAASHTIRSQMNAGITEFELGGDIDSSKAEDNTKDEEEDFKEDKKDTIVNFGTSAKSFKNFNVNTVPKNAFMIVIASRRSGKSHLITHFLEEYTKKNKVDGMFLFSKTNAGFDGIPSNYRYRDLDILPSIIDTQLKVKKHNENSKKKDKVTSNIIIVLDDMLGGASTLQGAMRKNPLLNKLSTNGRHLSSSHSNTMVILISQTYTGISPQIRLNTDILLTTKLSARLEREKIVNSFLSLNSGRQGLSESYGVFDTIVNSDDFNFIAIHTTHQNKKKFSDYVYNFKAPSKLKNKKLTGNKEDWKYNKKEIIF